MSVADVSLFLKELLTYCVPCALLINLTQFAVNAVISAIMGKGIRLNGK